MILEQKLNILNIPNTNLNVFLQCLLNLLKLLHLAILQNIFQESLKKLTFKK